MPSGRHYYFLSRLLLTGFTVAAPLLLVVGYLLYAQVRADEERAVASVLARVERAARETDAALTRAEHLLDFLSVRPELQTMEEESCIGLLSGSTQLDPLLINVTVIDTEGRPICRAITNAGGTKNFRGVPWFEEAVRSGEPSALTEPYIGSISQRLVLGVTKPFFNQAGKRIGVLVVSLDVERMGSALFWVDGWPEASVLGMFGAQGRIIAMNKENSAWINRPAERSVVQRSLGSKGKPVTFRSRGQDGVERVLAVAPLGHFNLHVGGGVPVEAVLAPSRTHLLQSLGAVALVALLCVLLGLRLAHSLNRLMVSLIKATKAFARGLMDAKADENMPGEFGHLAIEFNRMVHSFRNAEDARRAQAAAEAASEAKTQFLANMSHEIRTPMNAIIGLTDLALRGDMPQRQQGYLRNVQTAAQRLLGVINDILDFSKIEAGKLTLENVPFRLQHVFDRVIAVVGLSAHQKGLEVLLNTAKDVPDELVGDPLRLEQVLVNLCSNAIKFTDQGEVVIVTVRLVEPADGSIVLKFAVRDTGKGMAEDQVSQLFQPFNQLDPSTSRHHGGSGLGLAICKELVEMMGGQINVRSQLGRGSDFFFTAHFQQTTTEPTHGGPDGSLDGWRALVVEDNGSAREILQAQISALGASCQVSEGPPAALAAAGARGERFDFALVDWSLPGASGLELAKALGKRLPATPVLLMIPFGDEDLAQRAKAEGLAGTIQKPFSKFALAETVLALRSGAAGGHHRPHLAAPQAASASLRGRSVLLVEDNDFNQIVATELLRDHAGMKVDIATSGYEALVALRRGQFDVVLMDVQMPGLDGFETTRRIRSDERHRHVPIIAMTAHALQRDREKAIEAGMNDYVIKPISPRVLFEVLAHWLAQVPSPALAASSPDAMARPGVDFDLGLERCMGRSDLYGRIAARYVESRQGDSHVLRDALARSDWSRIAAVAHVSTSSAGTLGAELLSQISRALEEAADDQVDPVNIKDLVDQFAAEHERVMSELQALSATAATITEPKVSQ